MPLSRAQADVLAWLDQGARLDWFTADEHRVWARIGRRRLAIAPGEAAELVDLGAIRAAMVGPFVTTYRITPHGSRLLDRDPSGARERWPLTSEDRDAYGRLRRPLDRWHRERRDRINAPAS